MQTPATVNKMPTFTELRWYIAGSAHHRERLALSGQDLGNTKVTNLNMIQAPSKKYVLSLEVPVEDLILMDIIQGQHNLEREISNMQEKSFG